MRAVELAREGTPPSEFVTLESLENAFRVVCAIGGSSNAVIHLEALAGRAGLRLGVASLTEWSGTTPLLTDVRPSGPYLLDDLEEAGGVPAIIAELAPLLHLDCLAGTGERWTNVVRRTRRKPSPALLSLNQPKSGEGGLALLQGSLAPHGAVIKRSAASLDRVRGPAVVFEGVDDLLARIDDENLGVSAESILVLRNVGPVGGPGMPEIFEFPIPVRLSECGVNDLVRITDGRVSGTSAGNTVVHVAPEAAVGGPIALVRDGDSIAIDLASGRLDLCVPDAELEHRRVDLPRREAPARGYGRLHHLHVLQADAGCDLDFLVAGDAMSPRSHV